MIKPEELRIENWIYDRSKTRIVKVWGIESNHDQITVNHANGSVVYKVDLKDIEPIDLTEEWLLKMGFEDKYLTIDKKISSDFTMSLIPDKEGGYHFMPHATLKWGVDLKYVHQLQNLFFALKGKELTIKE